MKRISALVLAAVFLFASCDVPIDTAVSESDFEAPVVYKAHNGAFGVAFSSGESANPYTSANTLNVELSGLTCEPLFSLSESFEPVPCLCSEYSYSDKTYKFTLKGGVTFSDGSSLTADDVVYSLDAASQSGSFYASRLACIDSIKAQKKSNAVIVTLKYDNCRLPALLDIPIVKSGTKDDMLPIGTGMYVPNENLTELSAKSGHHSGKSPLYEKISLIDVSSSDEHIFEFETHNVSVLSGDPTGTLPLSPSGNAVITNVPTTQMHYIGFNTRLEFLKDASLRRAIACAIDRVSIAESDFALMGEATTLPIHPKSASFPKEVAAALDYASEKPVSSPRKLSILVNSESSGKLAAAKRISEALTRLGAECSVRALPFDEYVAALKSGDFTLYYASVALGADFDITRILAGYLNYGGFSDSAFSAEYLRYLASDETLEDFFKKFTETVPFAPVLFKDTAMYTEENFFANALPTSQNIYHAFADWTLGG